MDGFEQKLLALHDGLRSLEVPDDTEFTLPLPSGSLTLVNVTLGPGGGEGVRQSFNLRLSSRRELPTLPGHVVPEPDRLRPDQ